MEAQLSFSTLNWEEKRYKLFGVVTNRDSAEDKLIWWAIMILALNLNPSKGTRYILKLSQIGLNNTTQAIFPGFVVKTNH